MAAVLFPLLALPIASARAQAAAAFQVQGIFQFGPAHVGIAFTDSVDVAKALQRSRYSLTPRAGAPAIALQGVVLQENQRTVILTTTAAVPSGATYDVAINGLTSRAGTPLDPGGATSFTTIAGTVTGIADLHADLNNLLGRTVTLVGEVFITGVSSGGTPSAYIQDGTGRGLNIFGPTSPQPCVDTLGSVVKVTGTVTLYFSTVELTPFTATTIAYRMPPLAPRVLTAAQASSSQWEGTYIQTTARLSRMPTSSGTHNYNYRAESGAITKFMYRVRNATGINPALFAVGDTVTGAGAGAAFQDTFQIAVGNAADFRKGRGPGDITPPVLVSAAGEGTQTVVAVEFSEPVGAGADLPANYRLYPTAAPGNPIAVTAATVSGASVSLTLAAPLEAGIEYTVEVSHVTDSSGNPIPAASTIAFTAATPVPFGVIAAYPFGPNVVGVSFTKRVNATQATAPSHYVFAPALAIASTALQANGQTVLFKTAGPLPAGASYSLMVSGVTSATGEALADAGPFGFDIPSETVVDIAAVQSGSHNGQIVTVIGQCYLPVGSRGGTPSGYIQDGSGRGLNLFGGSIQGAVNQLGSVAKVRGTVSPYFTTMELTSYTATQIAGGLPHLAPRVLTVSEALSSVWEGTYIEVTGILSSMADSPPGNYAYGVTEGPLTLAFRVGNGVGISPSQFAPGDLITGRGAGGSFQSNFQINVGNRSDFFKVGGSGPDVTPPALALASGQARSGTIALTFTEAVNSLEATLLSSYHVWLAPDPDDSVGVVDVVMSANGRAVTLTLDRPLLPGRAYRIEGRGIRDLAGNVIQTGAFVEFVPGELPPPSARLRAVDGGSFPAVTLVRNLSRQGELFRFEIGGAPNTRAVCRIFDVQGRMVKVLFDGRFTGSAFTSALAWDGRDEAFEFVPAGLYICHLQTTDPGGNSSEARAPIVVAVRLHR